jgi:hypothetical protein
MLQGPCDTPTPFQSLGPRINPKMETLEAYNMVLQGLDGPTHSSLKFAPTEPP